MLKILTVILLILSLFSAKAERYYFSSTDGDDTRDFAQAQNPSTPWKTLKKLNAVFRTLQPGDTIFFRCGDTFYGTININNSGVVNKPIVLTSYGEGEQPIITSLVKMSGWNAVGNGIWESYNAALGAEVNIVLVDNALIEMGRYPNSNANNGGYLTIDSYKGNVAITDAELRGGADWTGAEAIIRKNRWAIDRNKIKSHVGQTINYASASSYDSKKGFGYFIQNHLKTLDQVGEWYYSPTDKKLFIYYGNVSPASKSIEAATLDNLVYSYGFSHIVFSNLTFKGGNTDSFRIRKGERIIVSCCNIMFSGRNGLKISTHAGFMIENSTVSYSNSTGVRVSGSSLYPIIRGNTIQNTGVYPGMGEVEGANGIGIQCYGEGALIEFNRVFNSGHNGIAIKLNRSTTKNNYISGFCSVKDDGGGIYSSNGSNKVLSGAKILGNIIENGIGATHGTNSTTSNAEGIYMDDNSNGAEIKNNTITKCHRGIYLHNARNLIVKENTSYGNEVQFFAKHDKSGEPLRKLTVEKNIFFSKLPTEWVAQIESRLDDITSMGSFDNNYYARPSDNEIIISTRLKKASGEKVNRLYDLESWKQSYGKDKGSKTSPVKISPYTLNKILGDNKIKNGGFSSDVNNVFGNKCVLEWRNNGLLDGGYIQITPLAYGSSIILGTGRLEVGKKYILRFSAVGVEDMNVAIFLRYGKKPYAPISSLEYRKIPSKRSKYEVLLEPSARDENGALVITVDQKKTISLDNLQLFEVEATVTDPNDFIWFEHNPSTKSKVFEIDGNYIDITGSDYSSKVVLASYSSLILIKKTKGMIQTLAD